MKIADDLDKSSFGGMAGTKSLFSKENRTVKTASIDILRVLLYREMG